MASERAELAMQNEFAIRAHPCASRQERALIQNLHTHTRLHALLIHRQVLHTSLALCVRSVARFSFVKKKSLEHHAHRRRRMTQKPTTMEKFDAEDLDALIEVRTLRGYLPAAGGVPRGM